jgi:hypothetical protein
MSILTLENYPLTEDGKAVVKGAGMSTMLAMKSTMSVALDLARLDQHLADIARWLPDPESRSSGIFDPEGMFRGLNTAISTVREEHLKAAIDTLKSAVLETSSDSAVREGDEP